MFWQSKREALQLELITVLKDEIAVLRTRHSRDCERVDRLMEALARKAGVDLIMPMPPPVATERVHVPNPWKDPTRVTGDFPEPAKVKA